MEHTSYLSNHFFPLKNVSPSNCCSPCDEGVAHTLEEALARCSLHAKGDRSVQPRRTSLRTTPTWFWTHRAILWRRIGRRADSRADRRRKETKKGQSQVLTCTGIVLLVYSTLMCQCPNEFYGVSGPHNSSYLGNIFSLVGCGASNYPPNLWTGDTPHLYSFYPCFQRRQLGECGLRQIDMLCSRCTPSASVNDSDKYAVAWLVAY